MPNYIGDVHVKLLCENTTAFEIDARDLIDILEVAIRDAPAEVADTLKVEMDVSTEWDVGIASLTVTRSETEAEAEEREKEEALRDAARRAEYRIRLRSDFETLKAIFDPAPPSSHSR